MAGIIHPNGTLEMDWSTRGIANYQIISCQVDDSFDCCQPPFVWNETLCSLTKKSVDLIYNSTKFGLIHKKFRAIKWMQCYLKAENFNRSSFIKYFEADVTYRSGIHLHWEYTCADYWLLINALFIKYCKLDPRGKCFDSNHLTINHNATSVTIDSIDPLNTYMLMFESQIRFGSVIKSIRIEKKIQVPAAMILYAIYTLIPVAIGSLILFVICYTICAIRGERRRTKRSSIGQCNLVRIELASLM